MTSRRSRLLAELTAALACAMSVAPAAAQSYPDRPIRIVVPFSPGGGTDTFARIVGQKLQERLGQPVVVENRPGAAGNIGAEAVARAAPDGYTLLLAQDSLAIVPWLSKGLGFDPMKDFAPIGVGVFMPMILVAANSLPVTSLQGLIDYARANPGKLAYGTPGSGTAHHLNFELLLTRIGARMVHVPYKGAAPMTADLVSGNLQVAFAALSSAMSLVNAGKLRVLAVADDERVAQAKDVPAIGEILKGYTAHVWFGLMAPVRTPEPIVTRLATELRAAVNLPDVKERLTDLGYQVKPTTPGQMTALMTSEYEKWGQVIKTAGIKPE